MNPHELEVVKTETGKLETVLGAFEALLDSADNRPLRKAAAKIMDALVHLHELDPEALCPENRQRVEDMAVGEKSKSGRDTFNTGF